MDLACGWFVNVEQELTVHLAGAGMVCSDPEDFGLEGYDIAAIRVLLAASLEKISCSLKNL